MLTSTDKQIQEILKNRVNLPLSPDDFAKIKNKRGLLKAITHNNYGKKYVIKFYYKIVQIREITSTSQFDNMDLEYDYELVFTGNWKKDRDRV